MTQDEALDMYFKLEKTLPNDGMGWDWTPNADQKQVSRRMCALMNYAMGSGPEPSSDWEAPKGVDTRVKEC